MSLPATATFAEFATLGGWKKSWVTALRKADRLVLTEDGKGVRVAESLARIKETEDPSRAGVAARHAATRLAAAGDGGTAVPATAPAGSQDESGADDEDTRATTGYQHWRERSERAKALAAERDNRVRDRELLEAGDVATTITAAVTTLRTRLESLPDVLGPQLAAELDEGRVRALLAETIEHALEEASRQFHVLAKGSTGD